MVTQKQKNNYTILFAAIAVILTVIGSVAAISTERGQYKEKIHVNTKSIEFLQHQLLQDIKDIDTKLDRLDKKFDEKISDINDNILDIYTKIPTNPNSK